MRYALIIGTIIGGAALFATAPARAAMAPAITINHAELNQQSAIQPVYWVWRGRRYWHRRWAPRRYYGGAWAPGRWRYY